MARVNDFDSDSSVDLSACGEKDAAFIRELDGVVDKDVQQSCQSFIVGVDFNELLAVSSQKEAFSSRFDGEGRYYIIEHLPQAEYRRRKSETVVDYIGIVDHILDCEVETKRNLVYLHYFVLHSVLVRRLLSLKVVH